jgi:hypothetical protein
MPGGIPEQKLNAVDPQRIDMNDRFPVTAFQPAAASRQSENSEKEKKYFT